MEGIELAARFGSVTNKLKYCGPAEFQKRFAAYLKSPNDMNRTALESALMKFEAHYQYLKLIADANGMEPFDYGVVEAFWLGNILLEKADKVRIQNTILHGLTGKGKMHIQRAIALADNLPEEIVPNHSFHTYYIKFITGKVEWTPENADKCRVPFGKITGMKGEKAAVNYCPILLQKGKFAFGDEVKREIGLKTEFIDLSKQVKRGDWVAFHWDVAIKRLDERERSNLEHYAKRNLDAINSLNK